RYLKNVTARTLEWYATAFQTYQRAVPGEELPTKASIQRFVMALCERGVKPISVNCWLRVLSAFCRWLHLEGHTAARVLVSKLKTEDKVIDTLTDVQVRALLSARTTPLLHALIASLLDMGLRIEEALTLTWADVDLDNCLVKVTGKGRKQRLVP